MLYAFYVGLIATSIFGLIILLKTIKVYGQGKSLSVGLSAGWWIMDTAYTC